MPRRYQAQVQPKYAAVPRTQLVPRTSKAAPAAQPVLIKGKGKQEQQPLDARADKGKGKKGRGKGRPSGR